MARNRVIGKDNKLPWHFSADLKYFKALTTGGTVIMGRKTFESIGKPLPNRSNFILTRQKDPFYGEGVVICNSIDEAVGQVKTSKAFIIGGQEIFAQTMEHVHGIYLTLIDADYEGDAFYPEIPGFFKEKSRTPLQDEPKIEVIFYENDSLKNNPSF